MTTGIRVNLTISENLEDVLKTSSRLLDLSLEGKDFYDIYDDILHYLKSEDNGPEKAALALNRIEEMRRYLVNFDMRLNDVENILRGFIEAFDNLQKQQAKAPDPTKAVADVNAPLSEQ